MIEELQGEGGRLQTKDRGLGRNQLCRFLGVGLLISRIVGKSISIA